MEQAFLLALEKARQQALELGVRIRPVPDMKSARRCLSGHRESDGFYALADKNRLDLSLEALAVSKAYTPLFSDDAVNTALTRLLTAGYKFS